MNKVHIKKNDKVLVLTGKDKGKQGKVLKVVPDEGKVLIDGVNVKKRHTKPRPPKVPKGGIIEKAASISASNVMLVCPRCNVPSRVGYKVVDNGKKVRVCKKCKEMI
jgi:large subunit ribosomal protein L24